MFKIGDIVELKSGGMKMTVSSIRSEDGLICCKWHNHSGGPETYHYLPEILKLTWRGE